MHPCYNASNACASATIKQCLRATIPAMRVAVHFIDSSNILLYHICQEGRMIDMKYPLNYAYIYALWPAPWRHDRGVRNNRFINRIMHHIYTYVSSVRVCVSK